MTITPKGLGTKDSGHLTVRKHWNLCSKRGLLYLEITKNLGGISGLSKEIRTYLLAQYQANKMFWLGHFKPIYCLKVCVLTRNWISNYAMCCKWKALYLEGKSDAFRFLDTWIHV